MATDTAQYTPALEVLAPVLRPLPIIGPWLAGVIALTIELRKIHILKAANADALAEIINRAELLSASIAKSRQTAEDRAQTLSPLIEELHMVVEKTKSRADQLRAREMSAPSFWETLCPCLCLPDQDKALKLLGNDMETAFRRFSNEAQIVVLSDVTQIREIVAGLQHDHQAMQSETLRTTLNPIDEALYTAHSAPRGCTNDTRQRILSEIIADVTQSEAQQSVCWISGLAGTGKSAIARSICDRLDAIQNVRLLSFFVSESSSARRDPICVLHTLAFYLAYTFPRCLPLLCDAIRRNAGALARSVQEQAKLLLEESISALSECPETLVIVLDAVDLLDQGPSGRDDPGRQLLEALVAFACLAPIRVRIIATGRPTRALRDLFTSMVSSDAPTRTVRVYKLEDVEAFEVKHDIRTFLRSSFARISAKNPALSAARWPPEPDLEAVATRSNGIFLYAAAAVQCLELHAPGGPEACLNGILQGGPAYRDLSAILDNVYRGVLGRVSSRPMPSPLTDQTRDLMGSLVIIEPRLPISDLALLMGYQPAEVQRILDLFHAVLIGGDLPSIFHPTFSQFIQDGTRCQDHRLVVDVSFQHANLASRCLGLVSASIGNNRGALAHGRIVNLAADLCRLAASRTPDARLYAFRSWPRHLSQAAKTAPELTQALALFTETLLQSWIDIMLEFETRASVEASIQGAAQWCEDHPDLAGVAEALRQSLREEGPPPFSTPSPIQLASDAPPSPPPIPESQSVYSLVSMERLASAISLPSSASELLGGRIDEERRAPDLTHRGASGSEDGNRDDATVARSVAVSLHHGSESDFEAPFTNADTVAIPGDGATPAADSRPSTEIPNNSRHDVGAGRDAPTHIPAVPGSHTALPVNGDSERGSSHGTS